MVKTPTGRKPGKRHEKVVKKLRHRRRMAARDAAARSAEEMPSETEEVSQVSVEVLQRTPELPQSQFLRESPDATKKSDAASGKNDKEKQIVPYKPWSRGVSESEAVVNKSAKSVVRPTVSESHLRQNGAIPLPAPPALSPDSTPSTEDIEAELDLPSSASTACTGDFCSHHGSDDEEDEAPAPTWKFEHEDDENREQHADEHTDRYLSHLMTPSATTITDEHAAPTAASEDYQRLRNLFSSDSERTKVLYTVGEDTASHRDKTLGLRSNEERRGFPSTLQEFTDDTKTLVPNCVACDTSCETSARRANGKSRQLQSAASTLGMRTLFNDDAPKSCDCTWRSLTDMPSMTEFSSTSLLGNLFASDHNVHRPDSADDSDDSVSEKDRKKALIAKDLAQYLNSDAEGHARSTSLSTFVQQIELLFDKYRHAIAEIDVLKQQIAQMKKKE